VRPTGTIKVSTADLRRIALRLASAGLTIGVTINLDANNLNPIVFFDFQRAIRHHFASFTRHAYRVDGNHIDDPTTAVAEGRVPNVLLTQQNFADCPWVVLELGRRRKRFMRANELRPLGPLEFEELQTFRLDKLLHIARKYGSPLGDKQQNFLLIGESHVILNRRSGTY
jgi:hypothetical protein